MNALAVLNQYNYKHIDSIIDYFISYGILSFSFNYFIKGGRGNTSSSLALNPQELFETTKKIIDRIEYYFKKAFYEL